MNVNPIPQVAERVSAPVIAAQREQVPARVERNVLEQLSGKN